MKLSFIRAAKLAELAQVAEKHGYEYIHVQSKDLLALGADPLNPTHVIDLTNEEIRPISGLPIPAEPETMAVSVSRRASRRSGDYHIVVNDTTIECVSLKELLSKGLRAFERYAPGTLDKLSAIMPRSKRIVSRDRHQLFDKPELVQKYSEKLIDGWWFGTNNSAAETLAWLRRGADIAGLEWGKDVTTHIR